MNSLILREWLNGGLIPLNICLMFIIGYSLWETRRTVGIGWSHHPGVASACALWWIFFADLLRAINAWIIIHRQNGGEKIQYVISSTPATLYIVTAVIAVLAIFRLIYVLSPRTWGHLGWIGSALFAALFLGVSQSGMMNWIAELVW